MTEKRFWILNTLTEYSGIKDKDKLLTFDEVVDLLNEQHETILSLHKTIEELDNCQKGQSHRINDLYLENKQLKSTIAQLIEQNRKNNNLLLSDIRILEKALWCSGCENDYRRLKELRKEFMR